MIEKYLYFVEQDVKRGLIIIFVCMIFTLLASVFDFVTKLEALRAAKIPPESRPIIKTGKKIVGYFQLIFYVLMADIIGLLATSFWVVPYCVVAITLGILFREGLSIYENYKLQKSASAEVVDMAAKIIECVTDDEAKKIIKALNDAQIVKHKKSN